MGRGRRICFPEAFFHCINRGNRRGKIFYDQQDYQQMLKCLGDTCERYNVLIQGCCLIPNHFHFLIQQKGLPVSNAMHSLETQYAIYFNKRYHKVGHLFQGRFRGILGEQQAYLLDLLRYIPLNPVRAKLVKQPHEWAWRCLPVYLGLSQSKWSYPAEVLAMFGNQPRPRLLDYRSHAPDLTREQLDPPEALSIPGSEEFVKEVTLAGEPRRGRRQACTGRKLPMQKGTVQLIDSNGSQSVLSAGKEFYEKWAHADRIEDLIKITIRSQP